MQNNNRTFNKPLPANQKCYDLIILGTGIAGLSAAYEIIRHAPTPAYSVLLLSETDLLTSSSSNHYPATTTTNASWNSAGILSTELGAANLHPETLRRVLTPPAPNSSTPPLSPFRTFSLHSLAMYPSWLQTLAQASKTSITLNPLDDYHLYPRSSPTATPHHSFRSLKKRLREYNFAPPEELATLPPSLKAHLPFTHPPQILKFYGELTLDPRALLRALRQALVCSNQATFYTTTAHTLKIRSQGQPAQHITLDTTDQSTHSERRFMGKKILLAAGSQLAPLLKTTPYTLTTYSVAGSALILEPFIPDTKALIHLAQNYYLLPRPQHNDTLFGTANKKAFPSNETTPSTPNEIFPPQINTSTQTTSSSIQELLTALKTYFKAFQTSSTSAPHPIIKETRLGIRGRSQDRLPLIGPIDSTLVKCPIFLSALYYKNGFSFAPLAATYLAHLIHRSPHVPLSPIETPIGTLPLDFFKHFTPKRPKGIQTKEMREPL